MCVVKLVTSKEVSRYESRPTINSVRMVWVFQPARWAMGEGTSPLRLQTASHKRQHVLATEAITSTQSDPI